MRVCTATAHTQNQICTWTAKTRAIPSLHRDNILAEVSGSCRCCRRVTQPPFIAGPLGGRHNTQDMKDIPITPQTKLELLYETESLLNITTESIDGIYELIRLARRFQSKLKPKQIPFNINELITLLKFRLFISFLIVDLASAMRIYLNAKLQYEAIFSARQIIVIVYEGYKKIYNFLNPRENEDLLKYRNNSFWVKDVGSIIKNNFPKMQNEYTELTTRLEKYFESNFALLKMRRNLSIHYDSDSIKVYEMFVNLDIEETYKKLIPFLDIIDNMSVLTGKIATLYDLSLINLNNSPTT